MKSRNLNNTIVMEYENIKTLTSNISNDKVTDIVYLIGKKEENNDYYTNLKLVVSSGIDGRSVIILPSTNEGYNPNITIIEQKDINKVDMIYTVTYGGSGGEIFANIYRIDNDLQYDLLFNSDEFNKELFNVNYIDNYRLEINDMKENSKFITNVDQEDSSYLKTIYDKAGRVKRQVKGSVLGVVFITPYKITAEGGWDYLVSRRVIGEIEADTIGFIDTILKSQGNKVEIFYNCFKKCPIL